MERDFENSTQCAESVIPDPFRFRKKTHEGFAKSLGGDMGKDAAQRLEGDVQAERQTAKDSTLCR